MHGRKRADARKQTDEDRAKLKQKIDMYRKAVAHAFEFVSVYEYGGVWPYNVEYAAHVQDLFP
jgi:hypothetical protein